MKRFTKEKNRFLDLIFPPACLYCNRKLDSLVEDTNKFLCDICTNEIAIAPTLYDGSSRKRLPDSRRFEYSKGSYPLAVAGKYDDPILKDMLWKLKYKKKSAAGKVLAAALIKTIVNIHLDFSNYTIIPIPLHWIRKRHRGFNQAELLARELGKSLHMPVVIGAMSRVHYTDPQIAKNFSDRKKNLEGAFFVKAPKYIRGRNILLLDDVFTSGATMDAAVEAVREAGANEVAGLVVAKTD